MSYNDGFINISLKGNIDLYYQRSSILKAIENNLVHFNGKLLDTGCGKMPYKDFLLERSSITKYVGLDIESAKVYDENVKPDYKWDGKKMPFEDESFDCAVATEVMEHVPNPNTFLSEVFRVLKKEGVFFFTTPFLWPLHEPPFDEYRYTPFSMRRFLAANRFSDVQVESLGGWNASLGQMIGLWVKRSPMSSRKRKMLQTLVLPLLKYLYKHDKSNSDFFRGPMITGISGIAYKR